MIRAIVQRSLCFLQLDRSLLRANRNRIVMLMYHGFTDQTSLPGLQNSEGNHVHVDRFREQLRYLEKHHTVMKLADALDALEGKAPIPENAVVLTMDDGYESNFSLAFPLLRELGLPASIFVTTGFVERREPLWPDRLEWSVGQAPRGRQAIAVDGEAIELHFDDDAQRRAGLLELVRRFKRIPQEHRQAALLAVEKQTGRSLMDVDPMPAVYRPLTWQQIGTLAASGLVDIGNHTHSHWILSGCSPAKQRADIQTAHELLRAHLGAPPRHFCYPNGQPEDYNADTMQLLRELEYRTAITTIVGANDSATSPLELRRYAVNNATTLDGFRVMLGGGFRGLLGKAA